MKRVQIIVSSVRPTRIGDQIGHWLLDIASSFDNLEFELVDLKDWPLPMNDEPDQPARGGYAQEHTRAWSRKVASADGYVFLTPQYNWGYPASLKNALDHLYPEWADKPAVIVSYGHRGGVRASAQLRDVLEGLHMKAATKMPAIVINHGMFDAAGRFADTATSLSPFRHDASEAIAELATLLG